MSKKSRLRGPFDKQHGKHDERLLKSAITLSLSYSLIAAKSI